MSAYRLLAFRFEISRHRTKALAVNACERRIRAGRKEVNEGRATTPFDYEIRRGKKFIYARGGYL